MIHLPEDIKSLLQQNRYCWLVTGGGGFIGSHLVEHLLDFGQDVVCLDKHTGHADLFRDHPSFSFIQGDICDEALCLKACGGVDIVLHHAAIGSVPRSFAEPALVDRVNVGGFINMMQAAHEKGSKRFIYASSSAVYGDYTEEPNQEDQPVKPLSPYAVGKYANELYAQTLGTAWGLETIGFRYFNIYGPRQDPAGAYAAVIPKWIESLQQEREVKIFGDGSALRDFCFVGDVVAANIIAALTPSAKALNEVYNIGMGQSISLLELLSELKPILAANVEVVHDDAREGDIRISRADVSKAEKLLGFEAITNVRAGLNYTNS